MESIGLAYDIIISYDHDTAICHSIYHHYGIYVCDAYLAFGASVTPQSAIIMRVAGVPLRLPNASTAFTTSIPSTTRPNTTCYIHIRIMMRRCGNEGKRKERTYAAIKVRCWYSGDEELTAIGVATTVGH